MRRNKKEEQKIALERIEKLYGLAEKNENYAKRYLKRAKELGMRYLVPIPRELKKKTCKKCFALLRPGKNCSVRVSAKKVLVKCECGAVKTLSG